MQHKIYKAAQIEEADAVAWVATSQDSALSMYPFKFPALRGQDVRVKILFTSICHSDIMTIRGLWGPCNYPACPGHEIVGEVSQLGSQVHNVQLGQKVGVSTLRHSCLKCRFCLRGYTNLCDERVFLYGEYFGGYATHIQLQCDWVFPLPTNFAKLEVIPPLLCAGVTVYAPLKRYQKVGAKCAILGIGGLGHLAIQFANKLGMRVTAFTTKLNNIESLRSLGAEDIAHSTDPVQLATLEGKFDVVLSTLFIKESELFKLHQRLTASKGVYITVGVPSVDVSFPVDINYQFENQIKICGSAVGSIDTVKQMLQFSADYGVESVNEYFEFADFNKALQRNQKSNPRYRAVVNVTNWAKANGFDK